MTKHGKGGWSLHFGWEDGRPWRMWGYTDPVTGNGESADGLRKVLRLRREREAKRV